VLYNRGWPSTLPRKTRAKPSASLPEEHPTKILLWNLLAGLALGILAPLASTQVNSGSNGSDGALNPTANLVIDMADHPDGIYHYTSVNIPAGVTVSFIPNAGNKPVVWLVQTSCLILGTIRVDGQSVINPVSAGGIGGCGGYRGGNAGNLATVGSGFGPCGESRACGVAMRHLELWGKLAGIHRHRADQSTEMLSSFH